MAAPSSGRWVITASKPATAAWPQNSFPPPPRNADFFPMHQDIADLRSAILPQRELPLPSTMQTPMWPHPKMKPRAIKRRRAEIHIRTIIIIWRRTIRRAGDLWHDRLLFGHIEIDLFRDVILAPKPATRAEVRRLRILVRLDGQRLDHVIIR